MSFQKEIQQKILYFEEKYPVYAWEIEGLKIWPFIRTQIFLKFIRQKNNLVNRKNVILKKKETTFSKFEVIFDVFTYRKWLNNIKKRKYLFIGSSAYRTKVEGYYFNKFFDSYIEINGIDKDAYFIELDYNTDEKYFNQELIIDFENFLFSYTKRLLFFKRKFNYNLNKFETFLSELKDLKITDNQYYSTKSFVEYYTRLIYPRYKFFLKLFKKIKPNKVLALCYYTPSGYAAIAAANILNIETIDYQHGAQGEHHLAYGSWYNMPEAGYVMIPNRFWVWDQSNLHSINKWSHNHSKYSVEVKGNFWKQYLEKNDLGYKINENFILYTLQSYSFEEHFTVGIIDAIRHTNLRWFLRLHPAYPQQREEIFNFFSEMNLLDKIEMQIANEFPLPILLNKCSFHITNCSGSATEALIHNKHSIIIDQIGQDYFYNEILVGEMTYICKKEINFKFLLSERIKILYNLNLININ